MLEIKKWVTPIVVGAYPDETVQTVAKRMQQHGIGSVIIHNPHHKPLGIITERDILNKIVAWGRNPKATKAGDIMTSPIETVNISCPVLEVFKIFAKRDFRHLPVCLDDGRIIGVLSLRSKAFIQEVCRIMDALKNVNELKSHFLANVSHELKTPLISIAKSASLLLNESDQMQREEILHFLEIIERQANHLQIMIGDLLDITALEAGKLKVCKRAVDLLPLIDQAIRQTRLFAKRKKIKVSVQRNTPESIVFADDTRITQVLTNLLDNAIKFTPPGGRIVVTVTREDDNKKTLRVAVKDTGLGIPKEKLRMIFKRFEQAHDPLIGTPTGTGLGLTIVKEIVALHNGKVWVESEENQGSTFYFTLPTKKASHNGPKAALRLSEVIPPANKKSG